METKIHHEKIAKHINRDVVIDSVDGITIIIRNPARFSGKHITIELDTEVE